MLSCDIVILIGLFITHIFAYKPVGLEQKYLLYSVNEHEGFNLRRDVYIRIANLIR